MYIYGLKTGTNHNPLSYILWNNRGSSGVQCDWSRIISQCLSQTAEESCSGWAETNHFTVQKHHEQLEESEEHSSFILQHKDTPCVRPNAHHISLFLSLSPWRLGFQSLEEAKDADRNKLQHWPFTAVGRRAGPGVWLLMESFGIEATELNLVWAQSETPSARCKISFVNEKRTKNNHNTSLNCCEVKIIQYQRTLINEMTSFYCGKTPIS